MSPGALITIPRRRARQILVIGALWFVSLIALIGWWTSVVVSQSERIVELEIANGTAPQLAEAKWHRTRRMLSGESVTFAVLVVGASSVLAWLYWRDTLRTRSLNAFFAGVTHELRNPLASLRLHAESLAEGAAGSVGHQVPQRLLEDLTRLENQIERMLELARVEGGGAVLDECVPLGPALARLRERVRESLAGKVELAIPALTPDALVLGDRVAIDVILRNLVDNAWRHGGKATVNVVMSVIPTRSSVKLRCLDDGQGYAEAGRLGDLFARGPKSQGAGIGLYLIRALMSQMGGSASFEARAGEGFIAELQFRRGAIDDV
jgi:signal transduction histidine kinase